MLDGGNDQFNNKNDLYEYIRSLSIGEIDRVDFAFILKMNLENFIE